MEFNSHIKGFSLVELMITIAIAAILMALAAPGFRDLIVSNRLTSDVNGYISLINYARSEAISRNQSVVVCPRNPANISCSNTQFWNENEIQVFIDANGNNDRNATDVLLKTMPILDATGAQTAVTRTGAAGATNKVIFGSLGYSQTALRLDIHTVSAADAAYEFKYGRGLCISKSGRVRVIPYSTNNCTDF
jgi:type IV fimbrial biogenesis protein FimT